MHTTRARLTGQVMQLFVGSAFAPRPLNDHAGKNAVSLGVVRLHRALQQIGDGAGEWVLALKAVQQPTVLPAHRHYYIHAAPVGVCANLR